MAKRGRPKKNKDTTVVVKSVEDLKLNGPATPAEIKREVAEFFDNYKSPSIDRPPREELEVVGKQQEMWELEQEHEDNVQSFDSAHPYAFNFDLKLTLKADVKKAKAYAIPIAAGAARADRVEELLKRAFKADNFITVLRAIIGDPIGEIECQPVLNPEEKPNSEKTAEGNKQEAFLNERKNSAIESKLPDPTEGMDMTKIF